MIVLAAVAIVGTAAASFLLHRFVEQPGVRLGRLVLRPAAPRAAST